MINWDNDTVIYNHGSAGTHIISDVPDEVLELVFSGQLFSDRDLFASINLATPDFNVEKKQKLLQEIKQQLIGMELVEII